MSSSSYYSHGKLLLTGEYAVLDGAKAIAFPCKLGQRLDVDPSATRSFEWTSYLNNGEVWKTLTFSKNDILNEAAGDEFKKRLFNILHQIYIEKPELFSEPLKFSTYLEFDKNWGLGSSSTLINNLASWAKINPYNLLENTFGGSGYDIAAAKTNTAFTFQKDNNSYKTENVAFPEVLKPFIFFIYLNEKQNSRDGIKRYKAVNADNKTGIINEISILTEKILKVHTLEEFETLIVSHENLISTLIEQTPVQNSKFPDYTDGIVKSLGAWGGDFVLVTAKNKSQLDYFKNKGYATIFNYSELILEKGN